VKGRGEIERKIKKERLRSSHIVLFVCFVLHCIVCDRKGKEWKGRGEICLRAARSCKNKNRDKEQVTKRSERKG
jgi:hypothetical protein